MRENKVTLHINVDKSIVDNFEKIYPRCRSRLVTNLFRLVISDRDLFERIFFCDLLKSK